MSNLTYRENEVVSLLENFSKNHNFLPHQIDVSIRHEELLFGEIETLRNKPVAMKSVHFTAVERSLIDCDEEEVGDQECSILPFLQAS